MESNFILVDTLIFPTQTESGDSVINVTGRSSNTPPKLMDASSCQVITNIQPTQLRNLSDWDDITLFVNRNSGMVSEGTSGKPPEGSGWEFLTGFTSIGESGYEVKGAAQYSTSESAKVH